MKKIECIFERHHQNELGELCPPDYKGARYLATIDINDNCEWVFNGEGTPTIKWDGTSVMIDDNARCYQRYMLRDRGANGQQAGNNGREDWILADKHPENGKLIYWVPVTDKWIIEAFNNTKLICAGTFEAIGPKINGNRYKAENHVLVRHGWGNLPEVPERNYESIKEFLRTFTLVIPELYRLECFHEGLVYHHPDGRMGKIRRADFGF